AGAWQPLRPTAASHERQPSRQFERNDMSDNRVVKFKGPRETAVEDIPYPKLEIPKEVADWLGIPTAAPHAAILKVVTVNSTRQRNSAWSLSAGVSKSRVFRGLELRRSATALRSAWVKPFM